MISRTSLLILCLILATTPMVFVAVAAPTVGVNAGEWIKWDITVSVPVQNETLTGWLQVNIQNVTGTQVSGTYVGSSGNQLGLPASSTDFAIDVATGTGTAIYRNVPLIVAANLSVNDSLPGTSLVVGNGTRRDDRDAAYAIGLTNGTSLSTYYWDRVKGVLLEATVNNPDNSTTGLKVVDTDMWGTGVRAGDWIRWDITVASQGQSTTMWLKVTINNVNITTSEVDATYESNLPGLPSDPTDFSVDVITGIQNTSIFSPIDRLMIVSANLNPNDPTPGNLLKVNGTTAKDGRDAAVVTLLTPSDGTSTYYWDRVKGVLLEFSSSSGSMTTLIKVADTNMWGPGQINWSLWISIAVIIIVVVVAAYMLMRMRRSRRSEKDHLSAR